MFDRSVLARSGSCEEMTNSLILFGAGASFGSGEVVPKAPPIAGRLLAALSRLYPNARGELSKESQSSLSEDFEAGMVAIGDRRPHALPPLERSMASFFFNFRPRVNNLYRELAQRMKKYSWSGALVTLNYERLLELSLLEEGLLPYQWHPASQRTTILWSCVFLTVVATSSASRYGEQLQGYRSLDSM